MRFAANEFVERLYGFSELYQMRQLSERTFQELLHLIDSKRIYVEEWPSAHRRLFDCRSMNLRSRDK